MLKLSDDKSYLGSVNGYDIYVDNISGLKHYFKDGKVVFEATWAHNGEDALIYKGDSSNEDKDNVKKFQIKKAIISITKSVFKGLIIGSVVGILGKSLMGNNNYINTIKYETSKISIVLSSEYNDYVTCEQIESYIEENDDLTEEEKEIYCNKKLLQDVVPYYENTNMNVLIPLRFDGLQTEYYYEEPDKNGEFTGAYFDPLIPNRIFVNTYYNENCGYDRNIIFYDRKAHENVHLLQIADEYRYIEEASAEIISCEYDDKCVSISYLNPVKNTKILMEIIGPEPIWKINFSGDDTDLVNIIRANLNEEQANDLISLLKEEPGKKQKKGLDEDITALLSQMYTNMYGEDMEMNPFIKDILLYIEGYYGIINNRYYFNSDKILKEAPYAERKVAHHYYAYAVSNNYSDIGQSDIFSEESKELFMLSKNEIAINSLKDLTDEMIKENGIIFYYQGEQIDLDRINLSKYDNVAVTYFSGVYPDSQMEIHKRYFPTIYESFPEQIIGLNNFTK